MAKWGEGDPRWIVEERPDATNVNNWHWTEKDASQWSKDKFKDLFGNMEIEGDIGKCHISDISKMEGDYVSIAGKVNGINEEFEGKIEIPNLSDENNVDEIDVAVSVKDGNDKALALKELLRITGARLIRNKLGLYINALREEFSTGMILPRKDQRVEPRDRTNTPQSVNASSDNTPTSGIKKLEISGVKVNTTTVSFTQIFKCTAQDVYRALTIPEMVQAFTNGPVKLNAKEGETFELFGGNVTGKFIKLIPNKYIEQTWRFKQWPEGHYSKVVLDISEKEDTTEIRLTQTGVPSSDVDRTREGWNNRYWESMKRIFGFGALLL
uniref:Activator of Hsp90 ATPase AHSA1-like N-terminal domain-containing protein n=1 Tax=Strigamia maritima TaxID=126957 RepID=T1IX34_STRMM